MKTDKIILCNSYEEATDIENIVNTVGILYHNLDAYKEAAEWEVFNALRIGRLLEGEALYRDNYERYTCVGFEIENENRDKYEKELNHEIGFFAVWAADRSKEAPLIFHRSYGEFGTTNVFDNQFGDRMDILRIRVQSDDVHKAIKWFIEQEWARRRGQK